MNRILEVWLLGQSVGQLIQADGRLSFSYSPHWLQSPNAQPLSRSLPLRPESLRQSHSALLCRPAT